MQPIDFNGPCTVNGLDTTVHGPLRLGVLTVLQLDGPKDFTALKKKLEAADGSLGLQLQKLEEAEYIRIEKTFVGRRPKTTYYLTKKGRAALSRYLDTLEQLLTAMGRPAGSVE
jgi:DNA-binding PadR family transcriptional regulator